MGFRESGIGIVGGGTWLCCLANGGAESRALRGVFGTVGGPCSCRERHTAIHPFLLSKSRAMPEETRRRGVIGVSTVISFTSSIAPRAPPGPESSW